MHHRAAGFDELLAFRFGGSTNAACWPRALPGDFAEVVRLLGPGEGLVALDEARLRDLAVSPAGRAAIDVMLADLALLRDAGRDPVLNIIYGYPRDESGDPVATDVLSWHADRAPIEADTWLCTYAGAASEGLPAGGATRKVDDPEIRAQLLRQFGGDDDAAFAEWLADNSYDLHYTPRPGVTPYSFGPHNLWRIACDWPGSPVLPCVHRAPDTKASRLMVIC
jgi:hypothetical protein